MTKVTITVEDTNGRLQIVEEAPVTNPRNVVAPLAAAIGRAVGAYRGEIGREYQRLMEAISAVAAVSVEPDPAEAERPAETAEATR